MQFLAVASAKSAKAAWLPSKAVSDREMVRIVFFMMLLFKKRKEAKVPMPFLTAKSAGR
jgi:hypothetical protein